MRKRLRNRLQRKEERRRTRANGGVKRRLRTMNRLRVPQYKALPKGTKPDPDGSKPPRVRPTLLPARPGRVSTR